MESKQNTSITVMKPVSPCQQYSICNTIEMRVYLNIGCWKDETENEHWQTARVCVCVCFENHGKTNTKRIKSNEWRIDEYYAQIDYHKYQSTLDWSSVTYNLDKCEMERDEEKIKKKYIYYLYYLQQYFFVRGWIYILTFR